MAQPITQIEKRLFEAFIDSRANNQAKFHISAQMLQEQSIDPVGLAAVAARYLAIPGAERIYDVHIDFREFGFTRRD